MEPIAVSQPRFEVLDGWRGISILMVMAGHLLPLGYGVIQLNHATAASGMALFFILSGFLIVNMLYKNQNVWSFLIKRICRIFPLAWLILAITFYFNDASMYAWVSNFLFFANWPLQSFNGEMGLTKETSHYWSLSLEVQFYFLIALLVFFLRKNALYLVPVMCLLVTANRIVYEVPIAINTYFRLDEILAGGSLALIYNSNSEILKRLFASLNPFLLFILLLASSSSLSDELAYLRPYLAMLLIGCTLFSSSDTLYSHLLKTKVLFYLATISFALYIFHGVLRHTWLGEGDTVVKYAKRPLLFLVTFLLAHLSTNYYEKYWVELGHRIAKKI